MSKKFYNCFSPRMMAFFAENNVLPEEMFFHHRTDRRVWVYEMNDKLSVLLTEWTSRRELHS